MPQRIGDSQSGGRRDVAGDGLEQLADEPVRGVGDEADPATGPADADELVGGADLVGREHRAEHRA